MTDKPRRLDCAQQCVIPDGVTLCEVPRSRHAWSDVVICPNDDCGRAFMTVTDPAPEPPMTDPTTPADSRPDGVRTTPDNRTGLLDDALGVLLGIPLRDRIDRHLLSGQRAEAAVERVRAVPRQPERFVPSGHEGRMYARGWEACRNEVDLALAECCVCGRPPVTYRNYKEQPFCAECANCDCNQDMCVRTRPSQAADTADAGRPFAALFTAGLLWLINSALFHPSGLAVTLHTDDLGRATGWSLVRSPNGEPWTFSDETNADGEQRARATLDAALQAGSDSVRTDEDDRPDMGGIVLGPAAVGETGCEPTSKDTARTVSEDTRADSPDTESSGFRFEYRSRVPRHLAGHAFAEAFSLLHKEMDANQPQPAELVQRDQDAQVSAPDRVDEKPDRLLHLVHGTIPTHEHLAAAEAAQCAIEDLRRRNSDLAATLGEVLAKFTVETQIGGWVVRTGYVGSKTVERWRQVLAGENRADAEAGRMPKVKGICPACRRESLFLGSGGFVTCAMLSCPKPDAPTDVLEQPPYAADECGRPDCTTALAGALERARRATDAYEALRVDVISAAKYIAQQQRFGHFARSSRTTMLTALARWVKDPGPLSAA